MLDNSDPKMVLRKILMLCSLHHNSDLILKGQKPTEMGTKEGCWLLTLSLLGHSGHFCIQWNFPAKQHTSVFANQDDG